MKMKLKIVGAVAMFLLALSMIGVGTFAWFTLSQKADAGDIMIVLDPYKYPFEASWDYEIKGFNEDAATWEKDLSVNEIFETANKSTDPAPLRPISTADMFHWYTADYDADGNVSGFSEREFAQIANQPRVPGANGEDDVGTNHVLWFDIWIRAMEEGETYGLKLQTAKPYTDSDGKTAYGDKLVKEVVEEETDEQGKYIYGTYVLGKPVRKNDGAGWNEPNAANGFNSLRIGFIPITEEGVINGRPLIYEPNYDLHLATLDGSRPEYGENVELIYRLNQASGTEVQGYSAAVESNEKDTYVPWTDGAGEPELVKQGGSLTYVTGNGTEYNLIYAKQTASLWNDEMLAELRPDEIGQVDSSYIKELGQFEQDELPTMVNITYGTPQRIRVIFWIEGQDVDCWNQIIGSDIIANFEFTGTAPDFMIP